MTVDGDPGSPKINTPGLNASVGYAGAHRRVYRANGQASEHACIDCGRQADDWSYVYGSQLERVEVRGQYMGLRYSPDPGDYVARCNPCHDAHDSSPREWAAPVRSDDIGPKG